MVTESASIPIGNRWHRQTRIIWEDSVQRDDLKQRAWQSFYHLKHCSCYAGWSDTILRGFSQPWLTSRPLIFHWPKQTYVAILSVNRWEVRFHRSPGGGRMEYLGMSLVTITEEGPRQPISFAFMQLMRLTQSSKQHKFQKCLLGEQMTIISHWQSALSPLPQIT